MQMSRKSAVEAAIAFSFFSIGTFVSMQNIFFWIQIILSAMIIVVCKIKGDTWSIKGKFVFKNQYNCYKIWLQCL
jgi:hypothetical protein